MIRDPVRDVHAQKRGDQRGHHQYHRDDGQSVDHMVQVVGNDARVGVHRAIQDVGVDVGHGRGLRIVNDNVFEKIGQVLIAVDVQEVRALHFHFEQLVGTQGVNEIDQTFFDGKQLAQLSISAAVHQLFFDAVAAKIERFEAGKKVIYVLFEKLQYEPLFVDGVEVADVVLQKLFKHGGLEGRDGHHVFDGQQNTDRDGDEVRLVFGGCVFVFDRGVDQYETYIAIALVTGAFVKVKGVGQEGRIEIKATSEFIELIRREGRGQVHPAARIWLGQFDQAAFFSCVVSGHCPLSSF